MTDRIMRLRKTIFESALDGIILTDLPSIRYFTGFTGSSAMLFISQDDLLVTTDGRYETQVKIELTDAELTNSEYQLVIGSISDQIKAISRAVPNGAQIGLDPNSASWGFVNILEESLAQKAQLLGRDNLGSQLRRIKDPNEIRRLEKAAQMADEALSRVLPQLKKGVSERDFAHNLEEEMYLLGSSEPSFETIVASGKNSAMPHAHPTRRIFEPGDMVIVDFGATFEGYHSDMTRTFVLGEPTQEQARVYLATKEAQALAISIVKEGVLAKEPDQKARDYLTSLGLGKYFSHSIGHGVGLEIHESPILHGSNSSQLNVGEVITIEPGVYIEGKFGVRIEDMVVVEEEGCRLITSFDSSWVVS